MAAMVDGLIPQPHHPGDRFFLPVITLPYRGCLALLRGPVGVSRRRGRGGSPPAAQAPAARPGGASPDFRRVRFEAARLGAPYLIHTDKVAELGGARLSGRFWGGLAWCLFSGVM